jgi:predicted DCC family thiol-disulfide oxidoreductase YuxK
MSEPKSVEVFYDGDCPVCRREAHHIDKLSPAGSANFIDIADPSFVAREHGLDGAAVQRELHARRADGTLVTGVDALAEMWQLVPRYRFLAALTRTPGVRQLMQVGYAVFARLRPRLPGRRRPSCAVGAHKPPA